MVPQISYNEVLVYVFWILCFVYILFKAKRMKVKYDEATKSLMDEMKMLKILNADKSNEINRKLDQVLECPRVPEGFEDCVPSILRLLEGMKILVEEKQKGTERALQDATDTLALAENRRDEIISEAQRRADERKKMISELSKARQAEADEYSLKTKAEAEKVAEDTKAEAQLEADKLVASARNEAGRIMAEARAKETAILAAAEAVRLQTSQFVASLTTAASPLDKPVEVGIPRAWPVSSIDPEIRLVALDGFENDVENDVKVEVAELLEALGSETVTGGKT